MFTKHGIYVHKYAATVMILLFNTLFAIGWLGITWLCPVQVTIRKLTCSRRPLSGA
jgi:hypothetical protein